MLFVVDSGGVECPRHERHSDFDGAQGKPVASRAVTVERIPADALYLIAFNDSVARGAAVLVSNQSHY